MTGWKVPARDHDSCTKGGVGATKYVADRLSLVQKDHRGTSGKSFWGSSVPQLHRQPHVLTRLAGRKEADLRTTAQPAGRGGLVIDPDAGDRGSRRSGTSEQDDEKLRYRAPQHTRRSGRSHCHESPASPGINRPPEIRSPTRGKGHTCWTDPHRFAQKLPVADDDPCKQGSAVGTSKEIFGSCALAQADHDL